VVLLDQTASEPPAAMRELRQDGVAVAVVGPTAAALLSSQLPRPEFRGEITRAELVAGWAAPRMLHQQVTAAPEVVAAEAAVAVE
jgi:hypothetical protein